MKAHDLILACAAVGMLLAARPCAAEKSMPDTCQARLQVKLTPDVPDPRDPAFLSALADNPLYELTWVGGSDTTVVLALRGPATDFHCEDEINLISRDTHVLDLKVLRED